MSGQRRVKQSPAEVKTAYKVATDRNNGTCEVCHRQPGNRHHRQGRDAFNTTPANLLLACGSGTTGCHGDIHANVARSRDRGLIVPDWAIPAEYPVLLWRRGDHGVMHAVWVLLDDHGGVTPIDAFEAARRIDGDFPGVSIYDLREES